MFEIFLWIGSIAVLVTFALFAVKKAHIKEPPVLPCFGTDAREDSAFYLANNCDSCYLENSCEQVYRYDSDNTFHSN
jgi:hypothetical protein